MKKAIRCNANIDLIRRSGLNSSKRCSKSLQSAGNIVLSIGKMVEPSVIDLRSLYSRSMFDIVWLIGNAAAFLSSVTSISATENDLRTSANSISGYWNETFELENWIFSIGIQMSKHWPCDRSSYQFVIWWISPCEALPRTFLDSRFSLF